MKNLRNRIFCFTYLFLCISVLILTLFKQQTTFLDMEKRDAHQFIKPTITNVLDFHFQYTFENALIDQIPLREKFLTFNRQVDYGLNSISVMSESDLALINAGPNVYTFDKLDGYLTEYPIQKDSNRENGAINASNSINNLAEYYTDLNFYVFKPYKLNETNIFDDVNGIDSKGMYYNELFVSLLDDDIQYATDFSLDLDYYEQHYFKTDAHWNALGAYNGYLKIADMFNNNYGDIEPKNNIKQYCLPNFDYYGLYGRQTAFIFDGEPFCDVIYDLPEYLTFFNGAIDQYDNKNDFIENGVSVDKNAVFYDLYYGLNMNEVVFINPTVENGRNLLVFNDSYVNPIKPVISSHFEKTIFIDLRKYPGFDIDLYISDNNITDVLYLVTSGSLFDGTSYHLKG